MELPTERLLLRRYREEDIPAMVALMGSREVAATTLRIPHPYTEEDARDFLSQSEAGLPLTRFAICVVATGELCGGIGLNVEEAHRRAELGYWIGVPYWRCGYATEAAREMVRYGFEHVSAGNDQSGRVLLKLGMKYEGRSRQNILKWGKFIDIENYGLLADEWRASRK
jgi:RimJ/RimL family protein N-acetyltransferase